MARYTFIIKKATNLQLLIREHDQGQLQMLPTWGRGGHLSLGKGATIGAIRALTWTDSDRQTQGHKLKTLTCL